MKIESLSCSCGLHKDCDGLVPVTKGDPKAPCECECHRSEIKRETK